MSYRDPSQALEPALDEILSGIRHFDEAVRQRVESGEWTAGHLAEIDNLRLQLLAYELRLNHLKRETW